VGGRAALLRQQPGLFIEDFGGLHQVDFIDFVASAVRLSATNYLAVGGGIAEGMLA
jgi:hypothetical protein